MYIIILYKSSVDNSDGTILILFLSFMILWKSKNWPVSNCRKISKCHSWLWNLQCWQSSLLVMEIAIRIISQIFPEESIRITITRNDVQWRWRVAVRSFIQISRRISYELSWMKIRYIQITGHGRFWETCATWELVMEDELYGIIGGDSVEVFTYPCNTYMIVNVTFGFN